VTTNRFLTIVNGVQRLVTAIAASAGGADASKLIATNGSGKLDVSFLPPGVSVQSEVIVTAENFAAGDFVNIYDAAGTRTTRKADASNNRPAHGFVLAASTSGQTATVYKSGSNNVLSGLTPGQLRYLSATTAGASVSTAPSAATQLQQTLGYADAATSILFEFDLPIYID
jgi:hypothetical protein